MTDRYQDPTVVSFVRGYHLEAAELTAAEAAGAFAAVLRETASGVKAGGGLVGHIKAVVDFFPGGKLRLSAVTTGAPQRGGDDFIAEARPARVEAAITAIVFGPSAEELNRLLAKALNGHLPEALLEDNHPD